MLGHLYENEECSAARTLELVGERWSLLILRDAMFRGSVRFVQFQRSLGIATNILAKRLDRFVDVGLMTRQPSPSGGDAPEYMLTQKGLELKPVLMALTEWGDKWLRPGPIVFRAESDGAPVKLQLRRGSDGKVVSVEDVVAKLR